MSSGPKPFVLPPYPYDLLDPVRAVAVERHGTAIDMSVGTPFDAPPEAVTEALSTSNSERGYPPSIGTPAFRDAAAQWLASQFSATVDPRHIGATIGLKEFVAGLAHWLRLREPEKDTVLYPAVSYPSYAMSAELAGGRAVAVPVDSNWRLRLDQISQDDIDRALCLWVNSPANPAGSIEDLEAVAAFGREHDLLIVSDECYIEFTWNGRGRTILEHGLDGVLAVHSLSKRSNLAGLRAGFYAGDPEIVHWLQEVRKHSGKMVPGPVQAAATVALGDQSHVELQRGIYLERLRQMADLLNDMGLDAPLPDGGFYLWAAAPGGDAWALTRRLAKEIGLIVAPGEFYGQQGAEHIRVAVVRPDEDIVELRRRLSLA